MDMRNRQKAERRKCQYCKQERDCRYGPDPYLLHTFDEVEMVWLCGECYDLRKDGEHLPESEDDV